MVKKLYIEPTSVCNLKCKMCFRNNWFDEEAIQMSDETCAAVIDTIIHGNFSGVFFGGMGEPLTHPQIYRMIAAAKETGAFVELITNATLLDKENTHKLLSAGLDMLWVSMEGFTKESYEEARRGSIYQSIMRNLEYYSKVKGFNKLGITFVMMNENISELKYLNTFADNLDVDCINLSHVVPGEALPDIDSIYDLDYPVGKMYRYDPLRHYIKQTDYCPFINEEVCFTRCDGEVVPCMQLLHNSYTYLFEERRTVHAFSFGNVNRVRFKDKFETS